MREVTEQERAQRRSIRLSGWVLAAIALVFYLLIIARHW
jgi:hypothetical protein